MAISHVKVVTQADMTGTVTVFNSLGGTQTIAATDLNRPSDWNSAHNQFLTIAGNTAGQSTVSGTNIVFAGGNNLTLSANGQTVSLVGPDLSPYLTTAQPPGAYLTTAMASNRGSDFVQATAVFAGTNASGTIASNGISVSVGNYITTARASNDAIGLNSALTANGVSVTANSSGLSLNFPAFLTTAALSNHSHGNPTLALTNISGTTASNSAGLTLSLSAADPIIGGGDGANILAAGTQTANTTGTIKFADSNGITFGMSLSTQITASHNGLTTAMASNAVTLSNIRVSAGTTSNLLSAITFADGNGISFGLNASTLTATVKTDYQSSNANYLTSQSNQNVTAANGGFAFQTLSFSNLNGISFGTSAGSAITASHNALTSQSNQTLGLYAVSNTTGQSSSSTFDARTLSFHGAGIASVGYSGGSVVISVPAGGGAGDGVNILAAGTQTAATTGTVVFSDSNGVTFGMSNSSVITASVAAPYTYSGFNPYADAEFFVGSYGNGTLLLEPERFPNMQFDRVLFPLNHSNASNSSGSHTLSFWVGLYTRNVSTLSLLTSASVSTALTCSGTAGSYSLFSGIRLHSIPLTTTLTEGNYWIGWVSRTTSAAANATYSNLILSNLQSIFVGHFGSSHNTTMQLTLGQGMYTATTSGIPGSIAFSQLRGSDSTIPRAQYIMFASSTV